MEDVNVSVNQFLGMELDAEPVEMTRFTMRRHANVLPPSNSCRFSSLLSISQSALSNPQRGLVCVSNQCVCHHVYHWNSSIVNGTKGYCDHELDRHQ